MLGFSQIGAESEWRTANTESIKAAAITSNIDLRFADAQQKQENQIKALRTLHRPEGRRDRVLARGGHRLGHGAHGSASAAGIPVILTDRAVTSDPSLYVGFLGSDFVEEGRKAGRWVSEKFKDVPGRREHRRTAGHRGFRARERSQEGIRRNHRRRIRA